MVSSAIKRPARCGKLSMPTLTPLKRFRDRNSKLFHPEIRRVPGLDIPHYFPGCIEAINFHSTPLVERKLTDGDKFAQTLSLFCALSLAS